MWFYWDFNGELICFFNLKGPMMRKEKIMCRRNVVAIVAVVMLAMAVGQVWAQAVDIPVPNGRFDMYKPGTSYTVRAYFPADWSQYIIGLGDNVPLADGGIANYADSTTGTVVDAPGWITPLTLPAWRDTTNPPDGVLDDFTTGACQLFTWGYDDGTEPFGRSSALNCFGAWSGQSGNLAESAESLGNVIGASTYTLSAMMIGDPAPLTFELRAGGVAITPSSSVTPVKPTTWQVISRTYDAAAIAPYVGQPLTIRLGTTPPHTTALDDPDRLTGSRLRFDNITFSQELPPPYPITPGDGGTVGINFDLLEWRLAEPNDPVGGTVSCDVWFSDNYPNYGQEPNNPDFTDYATKIVDNEPVESVSLSSLIPPIELEALHTYYWRIDMYDDSLPEPPAQPFISSVFIFNTNNMAPVVDAGTAEPTWLVDGTVNFDLHGSLVEDDGLPVAATLLWTVADPNLTIITDPTLPDITVKATGSGLFVVKLTADDTDLTGSDTVSVLIYPDWCVAIKALEGLTPRMTDHNGDCVTDVLDFAIFAREWLLRIDEPSPL